MKLHCSFFHNPRKFPIKIDLRQKKNLLFFIKKKHKQKEKRVYYQLPRCLSQNNLPYLIDQAIKKLLYIYIRSTNKSSRPKKEHSKITK